MHIYDYTTNDDFILALTMRANFCPDGEIWKAFGLRCLWSAFMTASGLIM